MTPYKEILSADRVANLRKLAAKLLTVPESQFDMDRFSYNPGESGMDSSCTVHQCGTIGCAVGWGPAAGVEAKDWDQDWWDYGHRVFISADESEAWDWCFSAGWSLTDNSPAGAARRILYLLDAGLPDDLYEQMEGDAPRCYDEVAAE